MNNNTLIHLYDLITNIISYFTRKYKRIEPLFLGFTANQVYSLINISDTNNFWVYEYVIDLNDKHDDQKFEVLTF